MRFLICAWLAMTFIAADAFGQDYQALRLGTGVGLIPAKRSATGFLLYIEPSWHASDFFAIGIKVESAAIPHADIDIIGSYTVNAKYYFTGAPARFFIGAGAGYYTTNKALLASESKPQTSKTLTGFYPRFGFDYRRLEIQLDFNFIRPVKEIIVPAVPNPPAQQYYNAQPSYLSLKAGFFIARKKS